MATLLGPPAPTSQKSSPVDGNTAGALERMEQGKDSREGYRHQFATTFLEVLEGGGTRRG